MKNRGQNSFPAIRFTARGSLSSSQTPPIRVSGAQKHDGEEANGSWDERITVREVNV
jgi:hypothetical protein